MDQMQSMRVFLRVVEAGTFTKAAESLGLPKGTVTKLVQHLESRLKVKLLHRTTRRVTVTDDGAAYYERVSRLINEIDEVEAGLARLNVLPSGRLRVDVPTVVADALLVPALPVFLARYPDIQLEMGVTDRAIDLIEDNVDCAVRGGVLLDESLVARRIGALQFVTVCSPEYLRHHGRPLHPEELAAGHLAVTFFSPRGGRKYPHHYQRGQERHECVLPCKLAVNESKALLAGCIAGLGIAQMLRFVAQPHIDAGRLVPILEDWTRPPLPSYIVYPPNRHLSGKVRAFVDWAAEVFSNGSHL